MNDTIFPFLKIARETNTPYGVVIRLAEKIDKRVRFIADPLEMASHNKVLDAVLFEQSRRYCVEVAERLKRSRRGNRA